MNSIMTLLKSNRFKVEADDKNRRGVWHKKYLSLFVNYADACLLLLQYPYLGGNKDNHYYRLGFIKDKISQYWMSMVEKSPSAEGGVPTVAVVERKTHNILTVFTAQTIPQKGSVPVETRWERDDSSGPYTYTAHIGNEIVKVYHERPELDADLVAAEQNIAHQIATQLKPQALST